MRSYNFTYWWEVVRIEGEDDEWSWYIESEIEPSVGPHNSKSFLGASLSAMAAMEDKATPALRSSRLKTKLLLLHDGASRDYAKDLEVLADEMFEDVEFPEGFWSLVFRLEKAGEIRGEAIRKAMVVFEVD